MTSPRTRAIAVYAELIILTGVTLAAAAVHPARATAVALAMAIASIKAGLILWYYMHMSEEGTAVRWIAASALILLLVLIIGLAPDFAWRIR